MKAEDLLAVTIQDFADEPARGVLICISGPSGVGKGTIIERLRAEWPELKSSVSVTTRKPRPSEKEGTHYYFRSVDEFKRMLAADEILEHDCYTGNYYGTPRKGIEEILSRGDDCVLDITVPGTLAIKEKFSEALSIFLLPPSLSELKKRLRGRGTEDEKSMASRLEQAVKEIQMAPQFDYVVLNRDIEKSLAEIRHIILAEKLRSKRRPGIEEKVLKR